MSDQERKACYPGGYKGAKPLEEQYRILRQFLGISADATYNELFGQPRLPVGAEGYFLIPRQAYVGTTYISAFRRMVACFPRFQDIAMDNKTTQRLERERSSLREIGEKQTAYKILVVPCQFGLQYAGRSVDHVNTVMRANEFPLGVYEVACMLLTHPERWSDITDFTVDCPGTSYSPRADNDFSKAFFFYTSAGNRCIGHRATRENMGSSGSATGFISR